MAGKKCEHNKHHKDCEECGGNVQPLCDRCNRMKLDYSEEEFDNHIVKIIQHRPELIERSGVQFSKAA